MHQQSKVAPDSDHAQTYIFLGNLYQQQGDAEKAMKIWSEGSAAFPESSALAKKLAASTQN